MRKFGIHIGFVLLSLCSFGQDIHFSQYAELPMNLNPALAGNSSSSKRAGLIYRNQWNSVTSPFQSSGFFGDMNVNPSFLNGSKIGIGLLFLNDRSGSGGLQQNHLLAAINYQRFINKKQTLLISIGPKIGFFQKSYDPTKLNFESDFAYESASFISNGSFENGSNSSVTALDFGIGTTITQFNKKGQESILGISLSHITEPNQGFVGNSPLPMLISFHASTVKSINKVLRVKPSVLYMRQRDFETTVLGGQFIYNLGRRLVEDTELKAGVYYRSFDALFFTFGINHDNWGINFAYDYNISGLQQAAPNVNAFEIAITIKNKIFKSKSRRFILPGNRLL